MQGKMLRAQSGLSETILLICTSAIWGKYPVFSLPEFLQGSLTVGSGCSLMAANWQVFFPSWVLSGLTSSPSAMTAVADDGDSLCLLIWQVLFHLSVFWVFFSGLIFFRSFSHLFFYLAFQNCKQYLKNWPYWDFPGGPVAKTLCCLCRGCGFDPWTEN